MTVQMTARNADLENMVALLQGQRERVMDVTVPASKIRMADDGSVEIRDVEQEITIDGVTSKPGLFRATQVFDEGLADKFGIPLRYVRTLRDERPDLLAANVNGWLHGRKPKYKMGGVAGGPTESQIVREGIPGDPRSFLVRTFRGDDGEQGIARALLSDRYAVMDNLDALMAALDGVRQAGVDVEIAGCDLSERNMYVRVVAPQVQALAPVLLGNYRSPFSGATGADNPTVFAGFQISNSEVGAGSFAITPRLVVQVCNNGMTLTKDAMRAVHLGGRMEEGVIRWSQDTERKELAAVTARARDAVATFLDVDYMTEVITRAERDAGVEISHPNTVREVTKSLRIDEATTDLILSHFTKAGDASAAGVMGAVTSAAQEVDDADKAAFLESQALPALAAAAKIGSAR